MALPPPRLPPLDLLDERELLLTRLVADRIADAPRDSDPAVAPPPAEAPLEPPAIAAAVVEDAEEPPELLRPDEPVEPREPPALKVPEGPPRPELPRLPRNCGVITVTNFSADVEPVMRTVLCRVRLAAAVDRIVAAAA